MITDPTSKGAQELEAKSADLVRIVQVPRPASPHHPWRLANPMYSWARMLCTASDERPSRCKLCD